MEVFDGRCAFEQGTVMSPKARSARDLKGSIVRSQFVWKWGRSVAAHSCAMVGGIYICRIHVVTSAVLCDGCYFFEWMPSFGSGSISFRQVKQRKSPRLEGFLSYVKLG